MSLKPVLLLLALMADLSAKAADSHCPTSPDSCRPFTTLHPDEPSIVIIVAQGRLGNHLIAYTMVRALAIDLNVQPFVMEETEQFMETIFHTSQPDFPPVLEKTFCNWQEMPFQPIHMGLDELLQDKRLHRGHLLNLWPQGYKEHEKVCCPVVELTHHLIQHHLTALRNEWLIFQPRYQIQAEATIRQVLAQLNQSVSDVNFVGIHHRRTDHIAYMQNLFYMKPLKTRYFVEAMRHFEEEAADDDVTAAFLYVSDDMAWGKKHLSTKKWPHLFFVGRGDPDDQESIGYDLAVLAACNATIISRGSFSTWAAILAGGHYYSEYGAIVFPDYQNVTFKRKKIPQSP